MIQAKSYDTIKIIMSRQQPKTLKTHLSDLDLGDIQRLESQNLKIKKMCSIEYNHWRKILYLQKLENNIYNE